MAATSISASNGKVVTLSAAAKRYCWLKAVLQPNSSAAAHSKASTRTQFNR